MSAPRSSSTRRGRLKPAGQKKARPNWLLIVPVVANATLVVLVIMLIKALLTAGLVRLVGAG